MLTMIQVDVVILFLTTLSSTQAWDHSRFGVLLASQLERCVDAPHSSMAFDIVLCCLVYLWMYVDWDKAVLRTSPMSRVMA